MPSPTGMGYQVTLLLRRASPRRWEKRGRLGEPLLEEKGLRVTGERGALGMQARVGRRRGVQVGQRLVRDTPREAIALTKRQLEALSLAMWKARHEAGMEGSWCGETESVEDAG